MSPFLLAATLVAQAAPPVQKPDVEALYTAFREAFDGERSPAAERALKTLEAAFPAHARSLDARKRFDAPLKTLPGRPAPAFRVPSLEDAGTAYSLDTFKGRPVLLEFWATWCPYCVADLPAVHRAWARFQSQGLEILSFSLDKRPEDVAAFRKAKQPMPWKHAFLPGMKAHPVAEAYGAASIPQYVLVGPDGRILASGNALRGERLEATLALHVGPAAAVLEEARAFARRTAEARKTGAPAPDAGTEERRLAGLVATETRPEPRQALLAARYQALLLQRKDPDPALVALLKRELPSTAPAWSLEAGLLPRFLETCFPDAAEAEAFAAPGRERHPDPAVRAGLLMAQFEAALGENEAIAQAALLRLEKEHPGASDTAFARRLWDAQAKTRVGAPAPAFAVQDLEHPGQTYTLDAFKGRFLLLDFWASWCPPCRAELPGVHRAWERFRGRGLEILSLSWDLKPEHVAAFRAKPGTPMPWKHAYLGRGKHALNEAYGVVGIPKPVLVGPDGTIVATDAQLRGERLFETLERLLPKP